MFLWTQFILNQEFKLTDLIIRTFQPIEISENPYHLKYLNLNLQLLYNSGN